MSPLKTFVTGGGLKSGAIASSSAASSSSASASSSTGNNHRIEYTLDQKIPPPDPSQFLPTGTVEYIEVDPEMSNSTSGAGLATTSLMASASSMTSAGGGGHFGGGHFGGGDIGISQEDTISIISNVEPTHYTPIDFHRTKGLIESKRENANEREKMLAS